MLSILGIVAIVVIAIQVYKTAVGTERNAPLWTVVSVLIGIALQFVLPLLIGIAIAVYLLATGTPPENIETEMFGAAVIINIAAIVLSIFGMSLVVKYASRVKDDGPGAGAPPPPPPTFGQGS